MQWLWANGAEQKRISQKRYLDSPAMARNLSNRLCSIYRCTHTQSSRARANFCLTTFSNRQTEIKNYDGRIFRVKRVLVFDVETPDLRVRCIFSFTWYGRFIHGQFGGFPARGFLSTYTYMRAESYCRQYYIILYLYAPRVYGVYSRRNPVRMRYRRTRRSCSCRQVVNQFSC